MPSAAVTPTSAKKQSYPQVILYDARGDACMYIHCIVPFQLEKEDVMISVSLLNQSVIVNISFDVSKSCPFSNYDSWAAQQK